MVRESTGERGARMAYGNSWIGRRLGERVLCGGIRAHTNGLSEGRGLVETRLGWDAASGACRGLSGRPKRRSVRGGTVRTGGGWETGRDVPGNISSMLGRETWGAERAADMAGRAEEGRGVG